jgi:hypothetical protein
MSKTMVRSEVKKNLMNYTGFMDKPGHFLGYKSIISAVGQASGGLTGTLNKMVFNDLVQNGDVKLFGKVYVVMANKAVK